MGKANQQRVKRIVTGDQRRVVHPLYSNNERIQSGFDDKYVWDDPKNRRFNTVECFSF